MENYLEQIHSALDREDTMAAARLAIGALERGGQDAILYNLAAWLHEEEGRFDEAEGLLEKALTLAPDDPTIHVGLGVVHRKQGRLREAVNCFEQAISFDPGYSSAWYERGSTFERGGAIEDAGQDYRRALGLEPHNPQFLASLATILARQGQLDEARTLAERALAISDAVPAAYRALAQVALEQKRYGDALDIIQKANLPMDDAGAGFQSIKGDALEGLGRYDEAYEAYLAGKKAFLELNEERMREISPEGLLQRLEGAAACFAALDKIDWISPLSPDPVSPSRHIFLAGHPRSGTTLAENILASLPNAVAIEERPTIAGIGQQMLAEADGLAKFAKLETSELEDLRKDYWDRAGKAAGVDLNGTLFIDMDPFKGGRLPFLAKLFPQAKYVITRRDPRDVVWSCFHTNFAFNAGTATFGTLETTARHYCATWTMAEEALATLPLDWFELRYEALVRDFDATTQALCRFLDVPWTEEVRQFDRTAQRRGVSTASATQVRQGLYDGSGGWKRYAKQMEPVLPILQPWIERFGYE